LPRGRWYTSTRQDHGPTLHEHFEVRRINHQEACSLDGACTNWAEEYFSRLRRAEVGIHHHIAGANILRYAQGSSRREDNRRIARSNLVAASRNQRRVAATSAEKRRVCSCRFCFRSATHYRRHRHASYSDDDQSPAPIYMVHQTECGRRNNRLPLSVIFRSAASSFGLFHHDFGMRAS
jgi:hypothetical protein